MEKSIEIKLMNESNNIRFVNYFRDSGEMRIAVIIGECSGCDGEEINLSLDEFKEVLSEMADFLKAISEV